MGNSASATEQVKSKERKLKEEQIKQKKKPHQTNLDQKAKFDKAGNRYFINEEGNPYYINDAGYQYFLDEEGRQFYIDKDGNHFYLNDKGEPYYLDGDGNIFYLDKKRTPFYLDKNGEIFYKDADGLPYFLDDNRTPFYYDEQKNKVILKSANGEISRDPSRKQRKGVRNVSRRESEINLNQDTSKSIKSEKLHSATTNETQDSTLSDNTCNSEAKCSVGTQYSLLEKPTTPAYINEVTTDTDIRRGAQAEADDKILAKLLEEEKKIAMLPPHKTYRKIGIYKTKIKGDSRDCSISGSAFLSSGELVLSDFNNKNLKLFDPDLKFISSLSLNFFPQNMCARAADFEVYVTFKGGIKVIKVAEGSMSILRSIKTAGPAYGISSNNGGLAVIINTVRGLHLHLMDTQGKLKKEIIPEVNDDRVLIKPEFMTVSKDLKLLVSDRGSNSVLGFNTNGDVEFEYKGLREPKGLSVDNKGSFFVATPMDIIQMSMSGQKITGLMTMQQIGFSPVCTSYDLDDELLVISGKSDNMVAFQLSDKLMAFTRQKPRKALDKDL